MRESLRAPSASPANYDDSVEFTHCYAATVRLANSRSGLPQLKARPPLVAVSLRELGAEQEDLGRVIDPYQNDDERARSAVG